MTIEEFANTFIQSFITKIKEDKWDIKDIKEWGFFADPSLIKMKKVGVYGYIKYHELMIGSSLDEDMDKFKSDIDAKDYLKYIEENIIVVANKLFVDFLQADA